MADPTDDYGAGTTTLPPTGTTTRSSIGAATLPGMGVDPIGDALAIIADALTAISEVPAWTLTEDAVLTRLSEVLQVRASVEELTSRLTASVAGRGVPRLAGASSMRAWLMATHRLSAVDAARLVTETAVHDSDDPTAATSAVG